MERYFRKITVAKQQTPPTENENAPSPLENEDMPSAINNEDVPLTEVNQEVQSSEHNSKRSRIEANSILDDLESDPGLRKPISEYHPNVQEQVRRAYLLKGPCQPQNHIFLSKIIGGQSRRFNRAWFTEFGSWLEYSIAKTAAFCLCCYLFRGESREQGGADVFSTTGFSNWKKKSYLQDHVSSYAHNASFQKCQNLMNQKQHITTVICKQSNQEDIDYTIRLTASLKCIRIILCQGLALRGHDESENSDNKGNFRELLEFLASNNKDVKDVVLRNAPKNLKLTSPLTQKQIVNACAVETTKAIMDDLGNAFFALLVDESRDVSTKEQMAVVLRYVDKKGSVVEHFVGIVHVPETTALTLKKEIESLFAKHNLSLDRLRGQGYDGASNMRGEFNGLKALILKENEQAFYIHCFAHQLQLTLVAVAEGHPEAGYIFSVVSDVLNIVGGSSKRNDVLRDKHLATVVEEVNNGERKTGRGLNQKIAAKRHGETRWGSHYGELVNFIIMFHALVEVLLIVQEEGSNSKQRHEAYILLETILSFKFAFIIHILRVVLGITNELSKALQRREQDVVNAMLLVEIAKQRLLDMRNNGYDSIINEVTSFCHKHHIDVPKMEKTFKAPGRSRRKVVETTNEHYYRIEIFYTIVDKQLSELYDRFDEVNTNLLLCMACLSPRKSFSSFDKGKLVHLAELYPKDFSRSDLVYLGNQLETYIIDMRSNIEFANLNGIGDLAMKMVETNRNVLYPLVYLLLTLTLTLPVATATVERAFSSLRIVKNRLRNRMEDELTNDCLLTYIEKKIFKRIDDEKILRRYQNMQNRTGKLSIID